MSYPVHHTTLCLSWGYIAAEPTPRSSVHRLAKSVSAISVPHLAAPCSTHCGEGDNHVFHRPRRRRPWLVRHAGAVLLKTARPTHMHTILSSARPCRHCTGRLRNGQHTTSKKHTVRAPPDSVQFVRAEVTSTFTCRPGPRTSRRGVEGGPYRTHRRAMPAQVRLAILRRP